jgi:toxin FitB
MNIVDSSCWLEYFAGSRSGDEIAVIVEDLENLIVPSITIYEVFRKLLVELDEDKAIFAIAHMKQGQVVDLNADIAVRAAQLAKEHKLPMADSIIYATNNKYNSVLWTHDSHFRGLASVRYLEKG